MKHIIIGLLSITVLSGCSAAPTRADHDEFKSLSQGIILPKSTLNFATCIYDGFLKSHSMLTNIETKQQIRPDGYRIETYSGGYILIMSADILKNGHVELWESSAAALINTTGEREAFSSCLDAFKI